MRQVSVPRDLAFAQTFGSLFWLPLAWRLSPSFLTFPDFRATGGGLRRKVLI